MRTDTIRRLNLLPINQVSAIKLKKAGIGVNLSQLSVFQLMAWGLSAGVPLTHRRTAIELERLCDEVPPGAALKYLLENVPGGESTLHKNLLRQNPKAAAQLLLEVLDMRLKADPRNPYPGSED